LPSVSLSVGAAQEAPSTIASRNLEPARDTESTATPVRQAEKTPNVQPDREAELKSLREAALRQYEYEDHLKHGQGRRITLKAITGATSFDEFSQYVFAYATDRLLSFVLVSGIAFGIFLSFRTMVRAKRIKSA
jgi:hypothetical protein